MVEFNFFEIITALSTRVTLTDSHLKSIYYERLKWSKICKNDANTKETNKKYANKKNRISE